MTIKIRCIFFLLTNCLSLSLLAQSGENAPAIYDQFFKNYFLLNPANPTTDEKLAVRLGNRTLTGLFQGVNRFYADLNYTLPNKEDQNKHALGLQAMNNRDGDYFQRNRLYARYSLQTRLSENASMSAGASVGFVSYVFGSSAASAGGSSTAPDANLGLWYLREKLKIGISYQQILSPRLRPLNQLFVLSKYFNVNGIYTLEFSPEVSLSTHAYWKWDPSAPFYGELAPILTIQEWLEIGANYRHQRGIAALVGFPRIPLGSGHLYLMASYLISTRKLSSQNDSVLEFSLGYILPTE